jgi:hypothetical protein
MFASLATVLASLVLSSLACQESSDFTMTFYGYPDNSPPGPQVALSCGGRNGVAGGTGTYADPLTMAAQEGRFTACEVVYSPYLQKYLRLEDTCAACTGDWVDVWTGSTTENGGSALSSCQDSLTGNDAPSRTLLMSPPDNLQVNCKNTYPIPRHLKILENLSNS